MPPKPAKLSLPDAIDRIRPGVVQIGMRTDRGDVPTTLGTGFIVDDRGTIVTALHVIDAAVDATSTGTGQLTVPTLTAGLAHPNLVPLGQGKGFLATQAFSYAELITLVVVPDHDLAALRPTADSEWPPEPVDVGDGISITALAGVVELDSTRPRDGTSVAVSGYPFASNSLVTNSGSIASGFYPNFDEIPEPERAARPPGADDGIYREETYSPGTPSDRYLADLEVNAGNSGGPVYFTETAKVLGVCVSTQSALVRNPRGAPALLGGEPLLYSSGLTTVIPTTYVRGMLRDPRVTA